MDRTCVTKIVEVRQGEPCPWDKVQYITPPRNKKINTKSSTETEVVSTDDCLPQIIWTKYFLDGQGYWCEYELQQDNNSAMRLDINGKKSIGKPTKHMEVRYFFTKYRVDAGDITIHYCPTAEMVGDFFTKPLQGAAFIRFRDLIMGKVAYDFRQHY